MLFYIKAEHVQILTQIYSPLNIASYSFILIRSPIHRVTPLLHIIHGTTQIQPGTPHYVCATESPGVKLHTETMTN